MIIVVDASVVISAYFYSSKIEKLLLFLSEKKDIVLYSPRYLKNELMNFIIYKKKREYIDRFYMQTIERILEKYSICLVELKEFLPFIAKAGDLTTDAKDIRYIALALLKDAFIWTRDKNHFTNYLKSLQHDELNQIIKKRYPASKSLFFLNRSMFPSITMHSNRYTINCYAEENGENFFCTKARRNGL